MAPENTDSHHEAKIRRLIAEQQKAVCAKDIDGIMAHYAADVVDGDAGAELDSGYGDLSEGSGHVEDRA